MADSWEVRVLLIDHRIVELAFTGRGKQKMQGGGRAILKDIAQDYFSRDFINSRKMGLTVPIEPWIQGHGKLFFERAFKGADLGEVVSQTYMDLCLNSFFEKKRDFVNQVYSLYLLSNWRQRHANASVQ